MNKRLSDAQPAESKIQKYLLNAGLIVAIRELKTKMEPSAVAGECVS